MSQQVNLFQPMFQHRRPVFAALGMSRALGVALLGLAAIFGYGAWQVDELGRRIAGLSEQRDQATARLLEFEASVPQRERSKLLAAEIDRLSVDVARRQALLAAVAQRVASEEQGFSSHLAGLARQPVEGLWLTGVEIAEGGNVLELSGSAIRPELVPRLVRSLASEPAFDGAMFRQLVIDRPSDSAYRVDFLLRTRLDGE